MEEGHLGAILGPFCIFARRGFPWQANQGADGYAKDDGGGHEEGGKEEDEEEEDGQLLCHGGSLLHML